MQTGITRRAVLGTAATLAGASLGLKAALANEQTPRVRLRFLETSDLHMFVLDWDYYQAKLDPTVGFAKIATLIREARAQAANTLLVDNGDFLQGSALGDYVAQGPRPSNTAPHAIVSVFNSLGYDAVGLGNHEFNYGLDFLQASFQGADFPFVCANVAWIDGREFLPPYTILNRTVKDESGGVHELKIGIIGFVTPYIMQWDKARLEGKIDAADIVTTARRYMPELRAKSDVVVALCHSGIGSGKWLKGQEDSCLNLAQVPGFDVIMTGHSHRVFPGKDYANIEGVDAVAGRLNGVPAVMPGFWGSHLGVVDLTLKRNGQRWSVENAEVETRSIYKRTGDTIQELTARDPGVSEVIAPSHKAALAWVERPIGTVEAPVHSYFVWAGYDPSTALVNAAQTWYARPLLDAAGCSQLPVLSSAAPFLAGYRPESFIDIPAGQLEFRKVASLYVFGVNTIVVVKVTGAQVLDWLEYAARVFNTIDPSGSPQALVNRRLPSYTFDTIAGVTYKIDVTQPPRHDSNGAVHPENRRIADLRFEGQPIDLNREFAVITNNYRADGGGKFPALANAEILLRAPDYNRDAIVRYFQANGAVPVPKTGPWTFAPLTRPTPVYFDTGKAANSHLSDVPRLTSLGDGEPGYSRVGLVL